MSMLQVYVLFVCMIHFRSLSFLLTVLEFHELMQDEVNLWFGESFPEQSSLAPFSAVMASFFWAEDDKKLN